jgi:hypothetical protein
MGVPLRIACQHARVVPAGTYPPIPASATPTERSCGDCDATAASAPVPSTDDHRVRMGVVRQNANHKPHNADPRAGEVPRQITRVNVAAMELENRIVVVTGYADLPHGRW